MAGGSAAPSSAGPERRRDPEDGRRRTYQETVDKYANKRTQQQIKSYWDNDMQENTPLLTTNSKKSSSKLRNAVMRPGRHGVEFHVKSVAWLVITPWSVFLMVAASTAFLLDRLAIISYLVVLACVLVSLIFIAVNFRNRQGPIYFYLGMLSLVAIFFGCCAGKTVSDDYMAQYWSPSVRPSYVDISPMSPAASVEDAGLLQFNENARVDTTRSLGVLDEDGYTYCVAPVLSAVEPSQVEFWAVGMDCCAHRGSFRCDDAQEVSARSGIPVPVASSRRAGRRAAKLWRAAEQASVVYGLHMPQQPVFLHWVEVPGEFRQSILLSSLVMLLCQCAVYLAISFLLASWLHWSTAQARTNGSQLFGFPIAANGVFDSKGTRPAAQV